MSAFTKESLAELLNGRQMGAEITQIEENEARDAGLVVVFGYSDDNTEFVGAIEGEWDCYEGETFRVTKKRIVVDRPAARGDKIEAVWSKDGYSWTYKTEIPHTTFDIMEDGEKFCRGIVFSLTDLPQ